MINTHTYNSYKQTLLWGPETQIRITALEVLRCSFLGASHPQKRMGGVFSDFLIRKTAFFTWILIDLWNAQVSLFSPNCRSEILLLLPTSNIFKEHLTHSPVGMSVRKSPQRIIPDPQALSTYHYYSFSLSSSGIHCCRVVKNKRPG